MLPHDRFWFQQTVNSTHIDTHIYPLQEEQGEVVFEPEPPVCTVGSKVQSHQNLYTFPVDFLFEQIEQVFFEIAFFPYFSVSLMSSGSVLFANVDKKHSNLLLIIILLVTWFIVNPFLTRESCKFVSVS